MSRILTAEEFVTLVLAKIKLKASKQDVALKTAFIDQRFEDAYDWLNRREQALKVKSNFTFRRDPLYGNTAKFRDVLLSLRERRIIQPDPSKQAYRVSLSVEMAKAYMKNGALKDAFLDELVDANFPEVAASVAA